MTTKSPENKLYFGDCLQILKKLYAEHPEGFIDLIYIDPPFNSKRNYNILFEDATLSDTKAQKEAFADTWSNVSYKDTFNELKEIELSLATFLQNLDNTSISKSAVSYLTTMAIRIWYMHKTLKETGSFYLHCDPTMSHYLKVVCDLIFKEKNFKDEIIWKRTFNSGSSKSLANKFPVSTDIILFYTKSENYHFNKQFRPYSKGALKRYDKEDGEGKYMWVPAKTMSQKRLEELRQKGELREGGGLKHPRYKKHFDENKGAVVDNLWDDIEQLGTKSQERLGYPTQKPEALLKRILDSSSNKGDLVADFFCGCGTTVAAAQQLRRRWLGVDISHLAIGLIKKRLIDTYTTNIINTFDIDGLPEDIASAHELAISPKGRLRFQDWIIETMLGGVHNPKKSADGGWDGHLTFDIGEKKEIVLVEVKSGNVNVKNLREFIHVINKQGAAVGVFVCFKNQVTKPMLLEAKEQGYYNKELFGANYDKIQILSVEDLLEDKMIHIPQTNKETFKKAVRKTATDAEQGTLEM